jgi:nodulation protein E
MKRVAVTGIGVVAPLGNDAGAFFDALCAGRSAMRLALADARLAPAEIGYMNAHGTGTAANDGVETAAIKRTFARRARAVSGQDAQSSSSHLRILPKSILRSSDSLSRKKTRITTM